MTAPAAMQLSRTTLFAAVLKERSKPFWARPTTDGNVRKLARAYPTTVFLLDWYCHFMQASKPLPFTSTWNLQINVALNTVRSMDKGLRLHNGFIHWRYASSEVGCGILYFLVALLDRWIELMCGGRLIGLAMVDSYGARITVGLSLVYYLFSAVVLDIKAAPLYEGVKNVSLDRIRSKQHLKEVARRDAKNKQKLYWGTLAKFTAFHAWGLAFCTAFVWVYVDDQDAAILFLAYMLAYSGVLWFQYNKVFTGPSAVGPLAIAAAIGFSVGIPLRLLKPDLFWNDVLSLAVATWTAGILTYRAVNLAAPEVEEESDQKKTFAHSQKSIGPRTKVTNEQLSTFFDHLDSLPASEKTVLDKQLPIANGVFQMLAGAQDYPKAPEIKAAFPNALELLDHILISWDTGNIMVIGVQQSRMTCDVRAVSRKVGGQLKIYVGIDPDWKSDFRTNCKAYTPKMSTLILELQRQSFTKRAKWVSVCRIAMPS